MTIKMTEAEFQGLGYQVDPDNPSQAVPIKADDLPNDSWEFERLMVYGSAAVTESGRLLTEAATLARRSTIQIFRAGRALSLARCKLPMGKKWGECLKEVGIPRTNAWEATQLFEKARSEEAVASLTPTEAKHKFGITKPKKPKDDEPDSPSIIGFPRSADQDQICDDDSCISDDHDDVGLGDILDDSEPEDQMVETDDQADLTAAVANEAPDNDPPEHEPESVLRLLVRINAALDLVVSMRAAEEDQDQIEAEIKQAHSLLDQIEVGIC